MTFFSLFRSWINVLYFSSAASCGVRSSNASCGLWLYAVMVFCKWAAQFVSFLSVKYLKIFSLIVLHSLSINPNVGWYCGSLVSWNTLLSLRYFWNSLLMNSDPLSVISFSGFPFSPIIFLNALRTTCAILTLSMEIPGCSLWIGQSLQPTKMSKTSSPVLSTRLWFVTTKLLEFSPCFLSAKQFLFFPFISFYFLPTSICDFHFLIFVFLI